ncbi:hypothetical protein KP509_19G078300 [Ceratopteris richardii]|uniref:PPM-type phosphatase domain-containing protein n=1 Tax=Ceratopteris richardii TaxID=49495 RepID=A0A8T2SQH6_CERRI|nr:hypothetical protein KP509_19G078300 [Ceratopteris richardii]KAH7353103.1 hypothetical protein KP509_19G078300 [Ceratopteris richardii]KAH7353104.1 hypothetical protein KP509_19G078300 [Ceratopteris richardii]
MGGNMSRVVGCFAPHERHDQVAVFLSEPFDDGLGHSFCYVRPVSAPSPSRLDIELGDAGSLSYGGARASTVSADGSAYSQDHHHAQSSLETSFKAISGASVSANPSTPRTITARERFSSFANVSYDRAAAFEGTASFNSLPLQPVPKGLSQSGPITGSMPGNALDRGFLSGPIERGFLSGPLERAFLSGPLERGCVSAPIEATDRALFSAPLTSSSYCAAYFRKRRRSLVQMVRNLGYPMRRVLSRSLSKTSLSLAKKQRRLMAPMKLLWFLHKEAPRNVCNHYECPLDSGYTSSSSESSSNHNVQFAQGKAGEDRMHVVLSEDHGWLFVGIYDGFSGPDAPDFLLSNLYKEVYKELRGLLWDVKDVTYDKEEKGPHSGGTDTEFTFPASAMHEKGHFIVLHGGREAQNDYSLFLSEIDQTSNFHACPEFPDNRTSNDRECPCNFFKYNTQETHAPVKEVDVLHCTSQHQQEAEKNVIKATEGTGFSCKGNSSACKNQRRIWFGRSLPDLKLRKSAHNKRGQSKQSRPINVVEQDHKFRGKKSEGSQHPENYSQHRNGAIDHSAVLKALSNALASTEKMFLQMADHSMKEMPELLLMGSCVLVMLMKGEDVYVMNVGDSRAILAQVRSDSRSCAVTSKVLSPLQTSDSEKAGTKDTQQGQDLERIMEETPSGLEKLDSSHTCSSTGPPAASLLLRALQLTIDHSTSAKEEVLRIQSEHPDDERSISNDRVKGRLKVTRAFGAGFLKLPRWNDALLEMFRVEYVGTSPYVTCIPAVCHHSLGPNDRFLVLSSDGLYQYLSNEEVVSQVEWFMENFPDGDPAQYLIEELLFRAAKKAGMDFHELLEIPQGDRRKYHDDVSVMVISLEGRIWRSFG